MIICTKMFRCLIIFQIAFIALSFATDLDIQPGVVIRVEDAPQQDENNVIYRLSGNVKPSHYELWIKTEVHAKNDEFNGKVIIDINVEAATKEIILHGKKLTIDTVKLSTTANPPVDLSGITFAPLNEDTQLLTINSENDIVAGNYKLEITYHSVLRTDDLGFYLSKYENEENVEVWLAATQFEAMNARHGFPCFDEPSFKATFSIKIEHVCAYNAISNGDVASIDPSDGNPEDTCTTTFEKTPLMSTYLVAFVVSDFTAIENYDGAKVPSRLKHRVFGNTKNLPNGDFALEAGEEILKALEDWTSIKFEMNKMDQIAIPDFYFGAMENWGLVTYVESGLYYDKINDPFSQRERVAALIGHEFAHQWFGNLVTLEWWEYIWLNEGFARLFQNLIMDTAYPEFKLMDYFSVRTLQNVMQSDASESTRAMNYLPTDTETIMNLFDNIAYDKSACVLRMIMYSISEEVFQEGVRNYLNKNMYKNTNPTALYTALQEIIALNPGSLPDGVNIAPIMNSWATQKGFPILHVEYEKTTGNIKITQERYLTEEGDEATKNIKWWIPVSILRYDDRHDENVQKSYAPDAWVIEKEQTIKTSDKLNLVDQEWIILNKGQTGYYRVNYDNDLWSQIIKELHNEIEEKSKTLMTFSKLLHPAQIKSSEPIEAPQRAQLIDDSLDLARTSRLSYEIPLQLLTYLTDLEHDYVPWEAAHNGLNRLYNAISGTTYYGRFLKYVQTLVEKKYSTLTLTEKNDEKEVDNYLRRNIIEWSCRTKLDKCLTETKDLLAKHLSKTDTFTVSPFLQSTIIKNGLRTSEKTVIVELLGDFENLNANTKAALIAGLGASEIDDVRAFVFQTLLTLDDGIIDGVKITYSLADRINILVAIVNGNDQGFEHVAQFLTANAAQIKLLVPVTENFPLYTSLLKAIAERTTTPKRFDTLKALFAVYTTPELVADIESYTSTVEKNIDWVEKQSKAIEDWLIENKYDEPDGASTIVISSLLIVVSVVVSWINM